MPSNTFYKLDKEKRDRVYKAILNEFTRAPLEEVSIKNIVTDAEIPRGSFYQYFTDKEDALRFLIVETREVTQDTIKADDIYHLLIELFNRETKALNNHIESIRLNILQQVSKSTKATYIFNEEITSGAMKSSIFKHFLENSHLVELKPIERTSVMELMISSLKDALFSVLLEPSKIMSIKQKLEYKMRLIKHGVEGL